MRVFLLLVTSLAAGCAAPEVGSYDGAGVAPPKRSRTTEVEVLSADEVTEAPVAAPPIAAPFVVARSKSFTASVALAGGSLWWTGGEGVRSCKLGAGTCTDERVCLSGFFAGVAAAGERVAVTKPGEVRVLETTANGCTPFAVLAGGAQAPASLIATDGDFFFRAGAAPVGTARHVERVGERSTPQVLHTGAVAVAKLSAADRRVDFVESNAQIVKSCPATSCRAAEEWLLRGPIRAIVATKTGPVVALGAPSELWRCTLGVKSCVPFGPKLDGHVNVLALDGEALLVGTHDGRVLRVDGEKVDTLLERDGAITAIAADGPNGAAVVDEVGADGQQGRSIVVFSLSAARGG